MLRRNRTPVSCEPCRIAKVRCDHVTPVCQRCQSRNIVNQCYYHPAPLTKAKGGNSGSLTKQKHRSQARSKSKAITCTSINSQRKANQCSYANFTGVPDSFFFLGPTSYLSVFRDAPLLTAPNDSLKAEFEQWRTDFTYTCSRLVHLISMVGFYYDQIAWYYGRGGFSIIPGPLVLRSLHLVQEHIEKNYRDMTSDKIYKEITSATSRPMKVTTNVSPNEFCSLFTGENLRWEFIGFIFALAGLSVQHRYKGTHILNLKGEEMDAETFTKEMVLAGNACIQICGQHGHVNDVMIWMRYTHALLVSEVLGETSQRLYSLLGDLVSSVYAMGLHYDCHCVNAPFYLSETRKRVLAIIHKGDKGVSTLLGRPPRLPHKYCDTTLPLDLADDQLFVADKASVLKGLNEDGWNRQGQFYPATVIRMRSILSTVREQVLELALERKHENYDENILKTYQSCQTAWDQIPVRFRYNSCCWQEKDIIECLARAIIYFEYLSSVFHLQRIRTRYTESPDATKDLLDTSMQVLAVVMDLIKQYHRHDVQKQFQWTFLVYGIPAAGVLVTELHRHTISNHPLPSSSSRSEIIRTLSTLISWLQTIEMPSSVTTNACVEVINVISRLLDEALNYRSFHSPPPCSTFQDPKHQLKSHNTGVRISTPFPEQCTEEMAQSPQPQITIGETSMGPSMGLSLGLEMDMRFGDDIMSEGLNWLDDLDWDTGNTVTADKAS
ncbi:hypothetical protein BGW36DRAFT_201165 [Talaromyces proteolyticus]|uniref:Zn(2)-C6 fungal-type domain-containing protein n=1 Tax=Talaromyces proteolyticus TaxID=1131652 RepID=A0AAD4KT53_9EURO|nr:uncharacterized protein BGW36DRAFT_201165 [Talaromyces proteolyticus]KAH8695375.1 hypothetical protein BGW36DRAFT_201165 [Talaromyces proteolyticus]